MRDFFARQEEARRQSGRLLLLFCLAVIAVALAVYLVAAVIWLWISFKSGEEAGLWQPQLLLWTTAGTLFFVAAASLWKIRELRNGGGAVIAMALGAKPVPPQTRDPRERLLRNVVEEMAIASGVPVPDLYLLERERGINAFAAGHDVNDAIICVTRGALELLSREELQGVVAHEFSHILNGDVLLNLRLMGWLNGILVVSQAGEMIFRGLRHSSGRGAGGMFVIGAALYLIGYLGYFLGQLIKSAVSRQREFLGDASAVQFTRHPGGLAGALKKIGGLTLGSRLDHPRAAEMSYMYFGSGVEDAWLHALDSHPPLKERISRLEPGFDGSFPKVEPLAPPPAQDSAYLAQAPRRAAQPEPEPVLSGAAVAALLERVGEPMQEHLELARRLLGELPEALFAATRDPFGACALVYGLLLDRDPALRRLQEQLVQCHEGAALAGELHRLAPDLEAVAPEIRLPLLDLALPALRSLSREQFQRLKETSAALAAVDQKESLFEFTLRYLLLRHLEPRFSPRPARAVQVYGIRGVQQECSCVLSWLARVGQREQNAAQGAFARGTLILHEPRAEFSLLPAAEIKKETLEQALATLEGVSPQIKRRLLAACLECMVHDRALQPAELELFRAVADALGCPVPPWLNPGQPPFSPSPVSPFPNTPPGSKITQ